MVTPRPIESIYIHIPFCMQKCNYCNFISYPEKRDRISDYFRALENETRYGLDKQKSRYSTVFIGGGTPSTADSFYYERILSIIPTRDDAEITIEVNPGTITAEYLAELLKIGVNRLSTGVQSFNNETLKLLNRPHSAEEAVGAVGLAKSEGFDNISIDLMYGLPGQNFNEWVKTLYKALELDIQHISTYGLKIEDGTEFARNTPSNLPDEDENADMYLKTIEILTANGFNHYEISNFCKPGYESRHNLAYWDNREYFGFGVAAHGYIERVRYINKETLEDYIANPLVKASEKELSESKIIEEQIFLGLRQLKGIDISGFKGKYDSIINKYSSMGLMKRENNMLMLTPQGILVSNNILAEFIG